MSAEASHFVALQETTECMRQQPRSRAVRGHLQYTAGNYVVRSRSQAKSISYSIRLPLHWPTTWSHDQTPSVPALSRTTKHRGNNRNTAVATKYATNPCGVSIVHAGTLQSAGERERISWFFL
jgi:hypothetical protein